MRGGVLGQPCLGWLAHLSLAPVPAWGSGQHRLSLVNLNFMFLVTYVFAHFSKQMFKSSVSSAVKESSGKHVFSAAQKVPGLQLLGGASLGFCSVTWVIRMHFTARHSPPSSAQGSLCSLPPVTTSKEGRVVAACPAASVIEPLRERLPRGVEICIWLVAAEQQDSEWCWRFSVLTSNYCNFCCVYTMVAGGSLVDYLPGSGRFQS